MKTIHTPVPDFSASLHGRRARRPLELLHAAHALAMQAHWNQTRKDGVTPQITHPLRVQRLLARCGVNDMEVHAAALLHDALEENPGEQGQRLLNAMARSLPRGVIETASALTDPPGLPTDFRKALQMERLAQAPWAVQVVKLADVVAGFEEGPAPGWTSDKKASYVRQRTELVREVLSPACGRLRVLFERALRQPVWGGAA
ncbi:MAG: hypothetical protein ACKOF9_08510 [Burkholderiales bacterium]